MKYKLKVTANTFVYPNIEKAAMAMRCLCEAEKCIGPNGGHQAPYISIEPIFEPIECPMAAIDKIQVEVKQ